MPSPAPSFPHSPRAAAAVRADPYVDFYRALATLREEFHRIGRFDDANAKLEELCKLLAIATLDRRHPLADGSLRLTEDHLVRVARERFRDPARLAGALHAVYDDVAATFPEELAAFGGNPGLSMATDDDGFARALVPLLASLPSSHSDRDRADGDGDGPWAFDGVNEAFGHFVQHSFRNRKEDAQYMTPPEVVSPLVGVAIDDAMRELAPIVGPDRPFRVADPTCGVGSFLAAAYRTALGTAIPAGNLADSLVLIGQDKVDRMVRLANVNLRIFARTTARIRPGNSVLPTSSLDDLTAPMDLVATNPPFGAEFSSAEVMAGTTNEQYPVLHALARKHGLPKVVNSEYVLLDRGLGLLRPGGRILIVVPDHVVSGSGFSQKFRETARTFASLEAVFDLPAETFAQAGTKTRTSVVYLRRNTEQRGPRRHFVVMATADDLGFRVKLRTGATVKRIVGTNDLEPIAATIRAFRRATAPTADIACLSERPSVAAVVEGEVRSDHWNAGFYRTQRLAALQTLESLGSSGTQPVGLDELATVNPPGGGKATARTGHTCISVRHVRQDGAIDLQAARRYQPTTACVPCLPGDVLMSRINPHIMRVCVVPEADDSFACSDEFAILRPRPERALSAAALALLLRTRVVQAQVCALTSGTSPSHNRVKPRELVMLRLPLPAPESAAGLVLRRAAEDYSTAIATHYESICQMAACDEHVARAMRAP